MQLLKRAIRKIKYIRDTYFFFPYTTVVSRMGISIKLYINNSFARGWYDDHEDWKELDFLKNEILEEGEVVADVGANIGFTSLYFAAIAGPRGKVYSFEPNPINIAAFKKNLLLNPAYDTITLYPYAVGSAKSRTRISTYSNSAVVQGLKTGVPVDQVSLDEVLDKNEPTFLKLDVEGHELEVLRGAERIVEKLKKFDLELHVVLLDEPEIKEVFDRLILKFTQIFIQLSPQDEIVPFNSKEHAVDLIKKYPVVHLFGRR